MPHSIVFDRLPAGYSLEAARKGDPVSLQHMEFTSTEDGQHFVQRLEGFPDEIMRLMGETVRVPPSQVDHMLAIVRKDRSATVYLNELAFALAFRIARPIEPGTPVFKDDIVDFDSLDLGPIAIPDDAGVAFLFSVRWRKGFFYDFAPLTNEATPRSYDCARLFGHLYGYVLFQERFAIDEATWAQLFAAKWFPFNALKHSTISMLLDHTRAGWNPDELLGDIISELTGRAEAIIESWNRSPIFHPHMALLQKAVQHFKSADYLSCSALLYPRVEGIMRTMIQTTGGGAATQATMCDTAVAPRVGEPRCLLLPHKFRQYLREVYFASFDPRDTAHDVSRNTVSHGIASVDKLDAKAAVIGLLTTHQLFYCSSPEPPSK